MTVPLRVLLVEDSPSDAKLVTLELQRAGYVVHSERVETQDAMREALDRGPWDVIISDWSLPTFSGPGALAVLEAHGTDVPFIIVSGTVGEAHAVSAMRHGADDYVLKDALARLVPAIERELREREERIARRAAERALVASEARFRRLAESGVMGIVTADIDGTIYDANDMYLRLVGYSREELVQGTIRWRDLEPPECAHLGDRTVRELQESGVASPLETVTLRKDGGRVPILVGVATLEYPKCIAFIVDLSERKRVEEERQELAGVAKTAQAGQMRAEEALRRTEDQLRQAQKMEAVGRLTGGIAHDFNNLLSVILSYGEIVLADLPPADPLRADVEEICRAGTRAATLVRQLLIFSRQEVTQPKVIDLGDTLANMGKMLPRMLGEDVTLVAGPGRSVGRIHADPSHVEQVILNLVVNARDAMPTGGTLTLETTDVVLEQPPADTHVPMLSGRYVMLTIRDTGTGMDRETQAKIFEPFFTTKERGRGTGLGLSTVYGIVEQSGGSIAVQSAPGQGTTFRVYLPRVDAEIEVAHHATEPSTLRGTETIVVVEDEDQVRALVVSVLQRQGYHVLAAPNAEEAKRVFEQWEGTIDLLVTDVVMPRIGGPELAGHLQQSHPALKVLYISGYADDSVARHGLSDPGVAFVHKPFTPARLAKTIREVLDRQGGQ